METSTLARTISCKGSQASTLACIEHKTNLRKSSSDRTKTESSCRSGPSLSLKLYICSVISSPASDLRWHLHSQTPCHSRPVAQTQAHGTCWNESSQTPPPPAPEIPAQNFSEARSQSSRPIRSRALRLYRSSFSSTGASFGGQGMGAIVDAMVMMMMVVVMTMMYDADGDTRK